ncbi:MAG: AmmeMemoRadiSam system protein A [Bacteroidales bacterium]|nr:AmmeMemoRadiSam system protein A [Bacteroidales bacterium]
MIEPATIFTKIALETILAYLQNSKFKKVEVPEVITEPLLNEKRGCFVSIHMEDDSLRGCIGTIEPVFENLYNEIRKNAISAAFRDSRFTPLSRNEIDKIVLSVDVLSPPEKILSFEDLDPEIYGVIVSDMFFRRAVLLPAIKSIRTVDEQIRIVKKKASVDKISDNELEYFRFTSTRYS